MRPARVLFSEHKEVGCYKVYGCNPKSLEKYFRRGFFGRHIRRNGTDLRSQKTRIMSAPSPALLLLPDKAIVAYEVLGAHLIGKALPLVLVSGMSATRNDWRALGPCLAQSRPGKKFLYFRFNH
jgi:hypothetical protein